MANKRTLKHTINQVCESLFVEAVAATVYRDDVKEDNAEALLHSIINTQTDFVTRVSHPEPGMKPKLYYKVLREQFAAQASDIVDHINNM